MQISTVIPVYNAEKYIKGTLEALLKQKDICNEIIIVDDGSTDKSGQICDVISKKNSNIKVYHITNHGVSYARNFGLKKATGDYIHFLDADDVITEHMYEKFFEAAYTYSPDIIVCGCRIQNIRDPKDYQLKHWEKSTLLKTKAECAEFIEKLNFKTDTWMLDYIWNKWYKTEKIRAASILFDEKLSISEDFAFNCDFFSIVDSMYIISDVLYIYTWHGEGLVSAFHGTPWIERNIVYAKEKRMCSNLNFKEAKKADDFEGFYSFLALKSLNSPRCNLNRKEKDRFIEEYIQSWQYDVLLEYFNSKGIKGKVLGCIIKIKPLYMLKILVRVDKMEKRIKARR